ncbi:MAG: hypothetical protein HN904_23125 [Victivallales bacterium]|nr:hypothetical protein [Victivallales bacterium]
MVVWASSGYGTLRPAGETTTDEDGNYRLSFAGGLMPFLPQDAIVSPRKDGYYEKGGHRRGILQIAAKAPVDAPRKGSAPRRTVLLHQPVRLDFVMLPAATVTVRVKDRPGWWSVKNRKVIVRGRELPPGASVVGTFTTDREGMFVVEDVPLKSYWFTAAAGRARSLRSNELKFTNPGRYEVEIVFDRRWRKKKLTARVVSSPPDPLASAKP